MTLPPPHTHGALEEICFGAPEDVHPGTLGLSAYSVHHSLIRGTGLGERGYQTQIVFLHLLVNSCT